MVSMAYVKGVVFRPQQWEVFAEEEAPVITEEVLPTLAEYFGMAAEEAPALEEVTAPALEEFGISAEEMFATAAREGGMIGVYSPELEAIGTESSAFSELSLGSLTEDTGKVISEDLGDLTGGGKAAIEELGAIEEVIPEPIPISNEVLNELNLGGITEDVIGSEAPAVTGSITEGLAALGSSPLVKYGALTILGLGGLATAYGIGTSIFGKSVTTGETPIPTGNGPCAKGLAAGNLAQAEYQTCLDCEKTLGLTDDSTMVKADQDKVQVCLTAALKIPTAAKSFCEANAAAADVVACKTCGGDALSQYTKDTKEYTNALAAVNACLAGEQKTTTDKTTTTPTKKTTGSSGSACKDSYTDAADIAACEACGGDTLDITNADAVAAYKICMQKGKAAAAAQDACDYLLAKGNLDQTTYPFCKSCEKSAGLSSTDAATITSADVTALVSCIKASGGVVTGAVGGGGGGTVSTQDQQTMANDAAAGKDPCADTSLAANVAAACKECYTAGMTSEQLVACVKGKVATGTAATGVVATVQKYAIPLAAGAAIIGIAVIATHGSLWGKKGGKTPPKIPPKIQPPQKVGRQMKIEEIKFKRRDESPEEKRQREEVQDKKFRLQDRREF